MAQGDTTVHVDFEVGGASAAKMTVMDVYRAQQANASKVNEAAKALAKEQNISFRDAKNAIKGLLAEERKAFTESKNAREKADSEAEAAMKRMMDGAVMQAKRRDDQDLANVRAHNRAKIQLWQKEQREKERLAKETFSKLDRMAQAHGKSSDGGGMGAGIGKLAGRGIWGAAMGVAGYAGVAGISSIISGLVSGINNFIDKRADLERTAAPLMALGDNAKNMKALRTEIVGIGASLGRSNDEVVGFLESMDSIAGSMSAEKMKEVKKESMELAELFGTDLQTAMRLLAKTQITYGDSFDSMNQAQNKMLVIQDKADVSFSEMALRMPELMANAKPLGITFDEVGAAIMATTAALGSAENAFTGTRNAIMIIQDAEKEGIQLTGSFAEKLEQLYDVAKNGDQVLMDLFKRDPLAAGATLVDRRKEVAQYIQELQKISSEEDTAADKIKQKFEDPTYKSSRLRDLDTALIENAPVIAAELGINNEITRAMERFRAGKVAGSTVSGGMFGVGTAAGILAMFGNEKMVDAGNKIRLSRLPEGSGLREDLIRQRVQYGYEQFQENGAAGAFDVNAAYANQPTLESRVQKDTAVVEEVSQSNRLLKEIRDLLQPRDFMLPMKPGGAKTNYEESV